VVHSLVNRPKKRRDDPGGSAMMGLDPDRAIGLWLQSNRQATQLSPVPGCRYLLVRYEDFVESPGTILRRIGEFVGQGRKEAGDVDSAEILVSHTISGNPDRLHKGARIRRSAGLDGIESSLQAQVERRTAGMLKEYGYRTWR